MGVRRNGESGISFTATGLKGPKISRKSEVNISIPIKLI